MVDHRQRSETLGHVAETDDRAAIQLQRKVRHRAFSIPSRRRTQARPFRDTVEEGGVGPAGQHACSAEIDARVHAAAGAAQSRDAAQSFARSCRSFGDLSIVERRQAQ